MNGKQLPFDTEAEMSVLAAIYLDPECYWQLTPGLKQEDFYLAKHRELFAAMTECLVHGPLDLVTLQDRLCKRGTLESVGGIGYVVELCDMLPTTENVKQYARIVADCGRRRRMIAGYRTAADRLFDRGVPVREVTDFVQGNIVASQGRNRRLRNIADSGVEFLEELERRQKSGNKLAGLSTGFEDLDMLLGGLEPGKLYIIGGRPSMGKTALALNIATNLAMDCNTVIYFSLEMRNYEVMKRVIASTAEIRSRRLKTAAIRDEEYAYIAETVGKFFPDSMLIEDGGFQTIQSIRSTCLGVNAQLAHSKNRIRCVMIDHLQLLSSGNGKADRRIQIGEMSRGAKILADQLECPVVLLSQLNRASIQRKSNRPMLSDLRESGDIEQDADAVMFVHREEYYQPTEQNRGKAEIILAKNRDGECGTLEYGWRSEITKFVDWAEFSSTGTKTHRIRQKEEETPYLQERF